MSVVEIVTTVLVSAGGGAVLLTALAAWLGKVWAARIAESDRSRHSQELEFLKTALGSLVEAERARFGAERKALDLILQKRIEKYPPMYALLSDIQKVLDPAPTVSLNLENALAQFNEWDSHTSIWMSVDTSNRCDAFRKTLLAAGTAEGGILSTENLRSLCEKAEDLEHGLRTDLGLAGKLLRQPEESSY